MDLNNGDANAAENSNEAMREGLANDAAGYIEGLLAESPEEENDQMDAGAGDPGTVADEDEENEEDTGTQEVEDEEPEEDEAPEGLDTLRMLDAEGKPVDVKLDDLLKDTVHTAVVDGEEIDVTYDELVDGYQRQADYTRKTMELSKERDELRPFTQMVAYAKNDPEFAAHIQRYFKEGPAQQLSQDAELQMDDDALAELMDENPDRARAIIKARADLRKKTEDRREIEQKAQTEIDNNFRAWVAAERDKASKLIPEYDKAGPQVLGYLDEVGFNEQERATLYDHRMALVAYEASMYRKMMREQNEPKKPRLSGKRKSPAPPKTMRSGSGKRKPLNQRNARNATNRAQQTGSTEDWADAIAARLGFE